MISPDHHQRRTVLGGHDGAPQSATVRSWEDMTEHHNVRYSRRLTPSGLSHESLDDDVDVLSRGVDVEGVVGHDERRDFAAGVAAVALDDLREDLVVVGVF